MVFCYSNQKVTKTEHHKVVSQNKLFLHKIVYIGVLYYSNRKSNQGRHLLALLLICFVLFCFALGCFSFPSFFFSFHIGDWTEAWLTMRQALHHYTTSPRLQFVFFCKSSYFCNYFFMCCIWKFVHMSVLCIDSRRGHQIPQYLKLQVVKCCLIMSTVIWILVPWKRNKHT